MYKIIYATENSVYFDTLGFTNDGIVLNIDGDFKEQTPVFNTVEEAEKFIYDQIDIDDYEHAGLHVVGLSEKDKETLGQ
ncbi:hypothetical protein [uncultured Weissella sp.]|uniref:hypothetical protein n=1 Tax=uncultured Weissella sp. TaxID=253243 RepID=UPI0025891929|nr:hypothetical protein [uncultured Weissella sp.]